MVAGYKRCPNGHFYKDDLAQCPYCSNSAGVPNATQASPAEYGGGRARGGDATMPGVGAAMPIGGATVSGGGSAPMPGGGATVSGGAAMSDPNKTRVMPEMGGGMGGETVRQSDAFIPAEPSNRVSTPPPASSKTMIIEDTPDVGFGGGEIRSSRKLVGWLVSYTLNDMGVDYKLFEGRNVIGRDLDCQISVNDNTVSGKHAVLLYREGSYFIQDSLSTSGTRVNGSDTGVNAVTLNDGDMIQVGKTVFKFRSSF